VKKSAGVGEARSPTNTTHACSKQQATLMFRRAEVRKADAPGTLYSARCGRTGKSGSATDSCYGHYSDGRRGCQHSVITGSTSRSVVGSQNSLCLVVGQHGTLRHLCHVAMSGGGRATPLVVLAAHAAIGDGPAQARGSRPLNQRTHTALEN